MHKGLWVVIIIVIVVIVAAFVIVRDPQAQPEVVQQATPTTGEVTNGADEGLVEQTELLAVGTYTGSGTATRSFDGTTFRHSVSAKIGDPADGKFYEGWLVMKTASGPQFFSTGKLIKSGEVYILRYSDSHDYQSHNDVVVTEETEANGLDGNPEAHVLEGSF